MRNPELWRPSKFVVRRGHLAGSRDSRELSVSSRLAADIVARLYEHNLPLYASGRLLDLGCGKAPLYGNYRALISESVCVDGANSLHENECVDDECDLSLPIPFPDMRFDTIILSDVLEHIPTPELLWRETARLLAPGGKLIMNVPFFYWLHETPHDYYRYTEYALRRYVEVSGLTLVKLEAIGGSPEVMADILAKHSARLPHVGRPVACFVQWLTQRFILTELGTRVSRLSARQFPFGYFLVAQKP